jgi:hypothetical protein
MVIWKIVVVIAVLGAHGHVLPKQTSPYSFESRAKCEAVFDLVAFKADIEVIARTLTDQHLDNVIYYECIPVKPLDPNGNPVTISPPAQRD